MRCLKICSILIFSCFVLTGCYIEQQKQLELQVASYNQEVAACRQEKKPNFKKPVLPHLRCLQRAEDKYISVSGTSEATLIQLFRSRLLVAGEKYDAGKISKEEFRLALNTANAELQAARENRFVAQRQLELAHRQAETVERIEREQERARQR